MPLVKPPLANVSAGQPVTAQAWNAIVAAIGALYDAVIAFGTNRVDVNVTDGTTPLTDAIVVAVPTSGAPVVAVPPHAGGTAFSLTNLTEGAWTVHVSARGYAVAQLAITVPVTSPVSINVTANTKVMPDLLGLTGSAAVARLNTDQIQLDAIYDVTGDVISKTSLSAKQAAARVLFQFPDPQERVTAATAKTRLVLSAEPEETQLTVMPHLVTMTYSELLKALHDHGLKLGNVDYVGQ